MDGLRRIHDLSIAAVSSSQTEVSTIPLWAGEPVKGPITLYHGGGRQKDFDGALDILSKIIQSERLAPSGFANYPEVLSVNILVYQHFLAHANENPEEIKSITYINEQEAKDPQFFAAAQQSLEYRLDQNFPDRYTLKIDRMTHAGREYTNHFTARINPSYGRHYTIQFDLTGNDIEELDRENAGGNSLYRQGEYLISPQPVPLKYATAIHFGSDPSEYDLFNLQVLLAEHHLDHIKIYASNGDLVVPDRDQCVAEVQKRKACKENEARRDLEREKQFAFQQACEKGNLQKVIDLLETDPPIEEDAYMSAVKYTACYGLNSVLKHLLKREIPNHEREKALNLAASNGHLRAVQLLAPGLSHEARWIAAYQAAIYNRLRIVEELIKNLSFDEKYTYFAISTAITENRPELFAILIKKFPLSWINTIHRNGAFSRNNDNLLIAAIRVRNLFALEKLLECGDLTKQDIDIAIHYAQDIRIVEMLLEYELNKNERTRVFSMIQVAASHSWHLIPQIAMRQLKYSFSSFIDSLE